MSQKKTLSKLFTPIKIGSVELKNRILMAPMVTHYGAPDGFMTLREKNYFIRRALGGVALITVGDCTIAPNCQIVPKHDGIWDDKFIPTWREFTKAIHNAGARVSIQLTHAGSQCSEKVTGTQPVSPSVLVSPLTGEMTRELSRDEIRELIEKWAEAAVRARKAGADTVEIQGSQGFLIHNFMTPLFNKRKDEYGNDLKGLMKFPLEVIKRIKEKVGSDYPVIFRMVVSDLVEGGLTLKDTKKMALMLIEAGVDALHLTAGAGLHLMNLFAPPVDAGTGCIVDLVGKIKDVVDVPLIVAQRIIDPMQAEKILRDGKADIICLGRALICDPDWPQKAAKRELEDIRKCIGCCQGCLDRSIDGTVSCLHNPEVGKEKEYAISRAENPKKVVVIGGGPAGLEAAKVSALRAHTVVLYEKGSELGGQWILASIPPMKQEFVEVIKYNIRQLEKLDLKIELNTEVTFTLIEQTNPDVVIVATGSVPIIPEIPGIKRDNIVTAHDILSGRASTVGETVAVLGGGLVGCETADFLANQGKTVTIIEMLEYIAADIGPVRKPFLIQRLAKGSVEILTSSQVVEIVEDGIIVKDRDEKKRNVGTYNTIVLALGVKSVSELAKQIEAEGTREVYVIGDALEPRRAIQAIAEGARVGREI